MKKKDCKIHIVGAGISGLIAATVLEEHGYHPVIIESGNMAGGRVKTDNVEGNQLDHGFQVLLTAYPMAQKYLNFKKLGLQKFLPGAVVFNLKIPRGSASGFQFSPSPFGGEGWGVGEIKISVFDLQVKMKPAKYP
ncbi:FAD/NAD(P)-binding protein [Aquimarina sp. 2201CG1-2-11]|uniref:NAD(P)-binding protein n=1 Tax=Aquimarina discodermiae TaxID=3231043 RepID=UPI003461A7A6